MGVVEEAPLAVRQAPADFTRLLREYDRDLDCRWNPDTECWVIWRQSRGRWFEEVVLDSRDPGSFTIDYLQSREIDKRFRRGWKGYREWLREVERKREAARQAERLDRIDQAWKDHRRKALPALRDNVAETTAFTVSGFRQEEGA